MLKHLIQAALACPPQLTSPQSISLQTMPPQSLAACPPGYPPVFRCRDSLRSLSPPSGAFAGQNLSASHPFGDSLSRLRSFPGCPPAVQRPSRREHRPAPLSSSAPFCPSAVDLGALYIGPPAAPLCHFHLPVLRRHVHFLPIPDEALLSSGSSYDIRFGKSGSHAPFPARISILASELFWTLGPSMCIIKLFPKRIEGIHTIAFR